jgi:deoxyribonuclease IV
MSTLRVRQIIEGMDSVSRASLKKLLPPKLKMPGVPTHKYPSGLLACFPAGEGYGFLGFVAEHLLQLPPSKITLDALIAESRSLYPEFSEVHEAKVRKSVTTQPFLDCLIATRKELEKVLRPADGALEFEPCVSSGSVEGHPDMKNTTQIFEVKLTGMMKPNWPAFLLQVFAYGAICTDVTDLYLVLPLQQTVWHADIRKWTTRKEYLVAMQTWSTKTQTTGADIMMKAMLLCNLYKIGFHAGKQKLLHDTVASFGDYSKPYQIFLSGPQNSKFTVQDADIAATLGLVQKTNAKIYVHSQYIINLCAKEANDNWHTKLLSKNLQVTRAFGGKGVVVHVGKSTDQPMAEALEKMRSAITECLDDATPECPLLLETPAGQGTETLRAMGEFLDFVDSFKDTRIRICLDTCHVFACGHKPLEYIEAALARPGLLKLIHYNDSLGECGSCVDRHAHVGSGNIGLEGMYEIAKRCDAAGLPMIIE